MLLLAAATTLAALALTPVQATTRPTLRLLDAQPLVLRGTGFRPDEAVKLTVLQPLLTSRRVHAGSAGRFMAGFAFSLGRCDDLDVRARGTRGSRARLTLEAPDCAEPKSSGPAKAGPLMLQVP